ncbi:MAG TPA: hypothetical protein VFP28_02090 [Gemmatimonadales bacterium]|nr:hypothetical protein [Gemmatimonadales bacterium]
MRRYRSLGAGLLAGAMLAVSACQNDSNPTAPEAAAPSARVQPAQGPELPSAAEFARQVPGFGGFFLAKDGTPTIYLTRGSSRAPAERLLSGYLSAHGLSTAAIRVAEGRYGWNQLQRWQDAASTEALAVTGAVFVDNDETSNRVLIGVDRLSAMGLVKAAAKRAGVPDDALIVQRTDPIHQVATLQNVVDRPVRAGVQINFPGFLCSVGFNATSGTQKSFITASHCTTKQGGVESTPYWQPLQSVNGTQIATEVADPVYVRGGAGCPKGKKCRVSDSSRAAYISGANQALGQIARTSGANNGSLDIVGSFSITSDDCSTLGGCLTVGTTVGKVGRTTGWTSGAITNTCVNTGVQGTSIVQLCQTFVSAGVGAGDSGSDVFQVTSSTNVMLAGILWGGNSNGTQFVFSPLANVVRDLGPLTTH